MKKTIITTVACLLAVASSMAQGRINFANTSATPIRIVGEESAGVPLILGTASTAAFGIGPASVRITLLAGLNSTSLSPVLIGSSGNFQYATNTASTAAAVQGTFTGGSNLALAGYDGSAPVFLQMSLTSINGLYAGLSSIIQVNLATGLATATTVFGGATVSASQWDISDSWSGDFTQNPVAIPEPSSMALAGFGAASLLLFRRRK